ncbi:MAG: hypothetical protein H0T89_32695 [Deltaproteobacteria bacterium]|nr:hypothetical protein [Deltaproteobacteria bacterium]
MRVMLLLLLAACDAHPSRLDAIVVTHGPDPTPRPRGARPIGEPRAEKRDERDRDLDRRLREVASRDMPDDDTGSGGVPLASVLGSTPGPFGPLAAIKPGMTRTELLAALPTAQRDGELIWLPTGIDGIAVELSFNRTERLAEIVYHVPLAARPLLVGAWGPPAHETNVWFDPTRGWRARLGEDPVNGKIELAIAAYRPFADVIGRGPDGLADPAPILGAKVADVARRFPLLDEAGPEDAELLLSATDVCAEPTRLVARTADGVVTGLELHQCYDGWDVQRRAALAAMEQRWGRATPTRTADDRLVFAWTLGTRRLEAEDTHDAHAGTAAWKVAIKPR